MGIYRTFWISCDSCGENSHSTNENCSQRDCVKNAKSSGWKKKRIQSKEWWFCPGCNPANCVTLKIKDGYVLLSATIQRKNVRLWQCKKTSATESISIYKDASGWSCGLAIVDPLRTLSEDPRRNGDNRDLVVVIDEIMKDVEHDLIAAFRAMISTDYPGSPWEEWALAMQTRKKVSRM